MNSSNLQFMKQLALNCPNKHPGANFEMMWLEFQCREGLKKEKYYLWYLIVHSALLPEIVLLMLGQGVWLGETVDCNQVRGKRILTNQFFRVCLCDEMCSVIFL